MGHFGALLLILSTQLLGFGLAGFTYSILIRPTAMVWPSSLVVLALYNTLHSVGNETQEGRQLTRDRMKFFSIVIIGIFFYQVSQLPVIKSCFSLSEEHASRMCENADRDLDAIWTSYTSSLFHPSWPRP